MKPQRGKKEEKAEHSSLHHLVFWLASFSYESFFYWVVLDCSEYRCDVIVICLHSSSHHSVLTEDEVTEATIDDPGGSLFSKTRVQNCSRSDNRIWLTHGRGHLRYKVGAQTQFTSLGTTSSSEEFSTRQRLQRGVQKLDAGLFIRKKLHYFSTSVQEHKKSKIMARIISEMFLNIKQRQGTILVSSSRKFQRIITETKGLLKAIQSLLYFTRLHF